MKLMIFFVGLFALQASAYSINDEDIEIYRAIQASGITPYVMEGQVTAWINSILQKIRDAGLDPVDREKTDVNITNIPYKLIELKGVLEKTFLENLANVTISQIKLQIIPLTLTLGLDWSPVDGYTDYDIDGALLDLIPVFGKGHLSGSLSGLSIFFSASLTTKNGSVVIRTLDLDFNIGGIHLEATGLLGGELGEVICQIVNENGVIIVGQFKDGYLEQMKTMIKGVVDKWLYGKTIQDIIDIITGKTTTPQPTTQAPTEAPHHIKY